MTGFVAAALALVAIALAVLLRPLWLPARSRSAARASAATHAEVNASVYRDELRKLDRDLAGGLLDAASHAKSREELGRRALEDIATESVEPRSGAPRATLAGLALALPLAAAALYGYLGHPGSLSPQPAAAEAGKADVERMVAGLAARLAAKPDDPKGWVMLARSYKVMGRLPDAERAYERAGSFIDTDAQELATYADIAASNAGGHFAGKPLQLVQKALAADPRHPMALWLAGTAALDAGDAQGAARIWERLVTLLPPESEDARELKTAIAQARGLGGAASEAPVAAPSAASVGGLVAIDPALSARVRPEDTVMVVARAPGRPMPVAVLRARVADLPLAFTLDDSMAMSPQARISGVTTVELEARVSRSGQAKPEPGDLHSGAQTVPVGATGLKLQISQVRP